jgi:poly(beta-D-mannuronate) lyase
MKSFRIWLFLAASSAAWAGEYRVSAASELARLTDRLVPGDVIVLADGTWKGQELVLRGRGTDGHPITFRAETAGKVIITGQSAVEVDGEYLVVSGLSVHEGEAAKEGIVIRGRHCRVTECAVTDSIYKFYVRLFGSDHRLDHCYFAGKTNESPTLQVEVGPEPNHHRIDHNHFGPRPPLGRNGGETIRVGYSHQSMNESRTTIEANLFERCDGELEIISNKSCDNVYRGNTFLECAGTLTLRHGNRCRVEGNFFLGNQKKGSGGIRIIGEDHVVVNNYIDGVTQGAFWVTAGIPNSPLVGYFQAKNCLIAFNTIVRSGGACVDLAAGLGSAGRTLSPQGITFANNLILSGPGEALFKGAENGGYRSLGNVAAATGMQPRAGFRFLDFQLAAADGIMRLLPSLQPFAAEGEFAEVLADIDGQPRKAPFDVGCDQRSDAPIVARPLTAAETGPTWRRLATASSTASPAAGAGQ